MGRGKLVGIPTLCVLAGLGIGAAAGCSDTGSTSTAVGAGVVSPATSNATELSPQQKASIRAAAGIPLVPDQVTQDAYVRDLNAIDSDIVHGKVEKAVSRGLNQCTSIKNGGSRQELVHLAEERFTSPSHPEGHGTTTAAKILDIVHRRLCPTY